jgi:hypothetical protein
MEDMQEVPDSTEGAVKDALARFLPKFSEGMREDERESAGATYRDLFTLAASTLDREHFHQDINDRIRKAGNMPLEGRRKMLEEDTLALELGRLDQQVRETALLLLLGETRATAEVKRGIRRTAARLGQVNAVLVGRFPQSTHLLEKVSEAYLDAMFILADGKGIMSTRLMKARDELNSRKKTG